MHVYLLFYYCFAVTIIDLRLGFGSGVQLPAGPPVAAQAFFPVCF